MKINATASAAGSFAATAAADNGGDAAISGVGMGVVL